MTESGPANQAIEGVYIFVAVAALAGAFVAQLFVSPRRRTTIIFVAAAALPALLIGSALIYFLFDGVDDGWFRAAVGLAFLFITLLFVGIVGAIVGSELATLAKWLLRRRD
jgi:FtsH-binding integral membrane protein